MGEGICEEFQKGLGKTFLVARGGGKVPAAEIGGSFPALEEVYGLPQANPGKLANKAGNEEKIPFTHNLSSVDPGPRRNQCLILAAGIFPPPWAMACVSLFPAPEFLYSHIAGKGREGLEEMNDE
jgi:hypothetical protein